MPKFEKQYVHFMWDSTLEGKMAFLADYISELQRRVEDNNVGHYAEVTQGAADLPFRMVNSQSCWQFVYYDPYYELKCAREQGYKIQALFGSKWLELSNPCWDLEPEMYRVKPEERPDERPEEKPEEKPEKRLVTNRELAKWLADGYGQFMHAQVGIARAHYGYHSYEASDDDAPIHEDIRVRAWCDEGWHVPTREYMDLDVWTKEE